MKMRNGLEYIEAERAPSTGEALAAKDVALKASLAYIESHHGDCEWWRDEQAYRTHRLLRQALETGGRRRRLQSGGYTFTEVMVGVTLTVLMSMSFFGLMNTSADMMRTARENVRATQILVNRLEGLRLYTWSQVTDPSLFPTNFTEYYYPEGTNDGMAGVLYTGVVRVATAPLSPMRSYGTNMYDVTVQLTWGSGNVVHTRQMSTYFARYGVQNYVIQN